MVTLVDVLKKSWFGAIFMGVGTLIAAMALAHPEGAQAPIWVVLVIGGIFFLAGASAVLRQFGIEALSTWVALPVAYGLAVPGLWLLFAGGNAQCSGGVGVAGIAVPISLDSLMCRGVFGFGALLVLLMAIALTVAAVKRSRAGRRRGPVASPADRGPAQ